MDKSNPIMESLNGMYTLASILSAIFIFTLVFPFFNILLVFCAITHPEHYEEIRELASIGADLDFVTGMGIFILVCNTVWWTIFKMGFTGIVITVISLTSSYILANLALAILEPDFGAVLLWFFLLIPAIFIYVLLWILAKYVFYLMMENED